ncbi:MAG: hypothetical protein JKY56_04745 [Kofleriaceae bacterium]|nr:hypothetical protein [Kofleriaceae bacterium]
MGILTQHITSEPVPPSITAQNNGRVLPPGVEEVILKAMKKEPNERFQNMSELIEALIPLYRSVAGSGMSTYMAAHHPATGAMPTLENGQPHASTSADASQPFIPVGMAPGQIPMGPPGTHPPGTQPPVAQAPGGYPPGTQPPVAQAPGGYPPGTQPPAAYAPQNQGYNTGAAPSDSLMMPATNSRKGIFIMIAIVFLGAGGAAAWFLTRPKTDEVASKDTDKGNGGSDTVAVNAGGDPVMDAAVNLAIDPLSDAATSAATMPMDAGVAAVLADANTVAVAMIADAAPTVTPPDAKIADKPIVPKTRTILVDSKPAKAVIYRDGKRLGRAPMNIEVKAGETLSLIFKYKKHKDLQFSLDDSKGKVTAKLVRKKRNGGTRPGPDRTGPDRTNPDRTPPKVKFCDRPGNQLKPRCMLE